MKLCEHGKEFNCLICEVKFLQYVIEELNKNISDLLKENLRLENEINKMENEKGEMKQ